MRLDLSLVEIFCRVAEEGSFSRAAEKLSLTQPTISGHIKSLEDYVGARLLDRLPRRNVLTQAGELLYKHGKAILNQKEAAIRELDRFLNRAEGSLKLCGSTIPGDYLLPEIIAFYHQHYPGVRVQLQILDSKGTCLEVLGGRAELGFVGGRFEAPGLAFRLLANDELVVVVPNDEQWQLRSSLTVSELSELPFLAREPGSGTRLGFERVIGRSLDDFNVVAHLGSTNAIKEALKSGLGVSVLSRLAVRAELASGALKTVELKGVQSLQREIFIVVNETLTMSALAERFVECALKMATR